MADIKPLRYVRNTGNTVGFSELQSGETIAWSDVNHPTFATVATTGAYSDLTGKPTLATVATTGAYSDLTGKPTVPTNLDSLTDVTITTASNGQVLQYNGSAWVNAIVGGTGTVTSVDVSGGSTGLTTSGGPITGAGTITLAGNLKANYRTTVASVSYSATPTFDWTGNDVMRITLTGNVTSSTFTGAVDGQKMILEIIQDATGSRTFTWPSDIRYGTDITSITLTTTANKKDRIALIYDSAASKYDVVAVIKGF